VACACFVISCSLSQLALADGLTRDGVGAISTGRGGTNIAHSDNGAVILDNPAGLVNFSEQNFAELGVDTIICRMNYTDPLNSATNALQPLPIPELAYIYNDEEGRFAAGIGAFAPTGFGASFELNNPIFGPGTHNYRSFGAEGKLLPALSYRVTDKLSVGATLGLGVSQVQLYAPFFLQTGPLAGTPAFFDMKTTGYTFVWSIGMQYVIDENTTVGAVFNSNSSFGQHGYLDAQVVVAPGPIVLPANYDARLALTFPRSAGIGIKHVIGEQHRISADVIWYGWHDAFDNLGLRLTNGTNPMLNGLLTAVTGSPNIHDSILLNWMDSVSIRTGYEFKATEDDVWRVGYVYHPSPAPSSTLCPLIDGILTQAVSAGYSHRWESWLFNLAYQYSFSPNRHVDQSLIVGGNFNNSSLQAQAHWISISLVHSF
jgi:long-subunit fatty acid transport protein